MSDHYEGVLLEAMHDDIKRIAEAVSGLAGKIDSIDQRLIGVERVVAIVPSIKAAIIDQSSVLKGYEQRITALE